MLTWDNGYLVVLTQYRSRPAEEEYIDLLPILSNLYMDPEAFLSPIKEVKISNYLEMYEKWAADSPNGFHNGR